LSLQSTTEPSARCSCMLQCNSVAASGFFAVNGSATYLLGCTSICHVIPVTRSPVFLIVYVPAAGLATSITVTPSGISRSIDVAATFASLWTRNSYFCTTPGFDCSGDTVTCADNDVTADAASNRTTESF